MATVFKGANMEDVADVTCEKCGVHSEERVVGLWEGRDAGQHAEMVWLKPAPENKQYTGKASGDLS